MVKTYKSNRTHFSMIKVVRVFIFTQWRAGKHRLAVFVVNYFEAQSGTRG